MLLRALRQRLLVAIVAVAVDVAVVVRSISIYLVHIGPLGPL